jgi:hypothetical protein
MAERDRLDFAFKNLDVADWQAFEEFCSVFFATEFPDLRTIAGPGDLGRDAILFAAQEPGVVLQYSIAQDWQGKIRGTIARLKEAGVEHTVLVYATNQTIGPRADDLKRELRGDGLQLDVRDKSFFLDRIDRSAATQAASRRLSDLIVTPLLPTDDLVRNTALTDAELRAGLLYLELHLRDADRNRNLTSLTFEGLVLAVLADTGPENRRSRAEVLADVQRSLPDHDPERVGQLVHGALERLRNAERLTYQLASDSFALHYSERVSIERLSGEAATARDVVRTQLGYRLQDAAASLDLEKDPSSSDAVVGLLEEVFERALEAEGIAFVESIQNPERQLRRVEVYDIARPLIEAQFRELRGLGLSVDALAEAISETVTRALLSPGDELQTWLRTLADAYILLAFLRETPDVQTAVEHLFGSGKLVLDTTAILPCIAEARLPPAERRYTNLLLGAKAAGMELLATNGAVSELDAHLSLCIDFRQQGDRRDRFPFVLRRWIEIHGSDAGFSDFVEQLRGRDRPLDDLWIFLQSELGLIPIDLEPYEDRTPLETRAPAGDLWREAKRRRGRRFTGELDLLLRHDMEMYFGVLGLRRDERPGGVQGHEAWLVTSESFAFRLAHEAARAGVPLPSNPCMHPNFLSNLLSIGPGRQGLEPQMHSLLPVALNIQAYGWGVPELSAIAEDVQRQHADEPAYVTRRRTRERVEELKRRQDLLDEPADLSGEVELAPDDPQA